ncbi:MAG: hypothetical protein ACHQRJ_12455 [Alphaproteobacteria bacterium]|nr:hypothetical protein [Alphaproteobacteria bacterium]
MKLMRTALLALALLLALAGARASAQDLTGAWAAAPYGGTYYVRQIGSEVWWFGDGGSSWANVAHGRLEGNRIRMQWADVPRGGTQNFGELEVVVESPYRLVLRRATGGFGARVWTRQ